MAGLPLLPRLVVTRITPFAARLPYIAAEASFNTCTEAITAGSITGVVQSIGLFTTELKQFDGLFVMVPNNELWNQAIVNFHRHPTRRFELVVGIGYGDSMRQARDTLLEIAEQDERVLADPAPVTFVNSLDDSSVGIGLLLERLKLLRNLNGDLKLAGMSPFLRDRNEDTSLFV